VVPDQPATLPAPAGPTIVIAVAPTNAHRLRIADAVGDTAPVLLVATVREAIALLARDASVSALVEEVPAAGELTAGVMPEGVSALHDVTDLSPYGFPEQGLFIDSDARVAVCGDRQTDLSPLEHDLLLSLQEAGGHIRTFEWLQRHVWHNDHQGGRSHVQSVVKRLRRKLRSISSPLQIDAVRGVGLRLVGATASGDADV
jgi:DNA-binding response OmpR family regulator